MDKKLHLLLVSLLTLLGKFCAHMKNLETNSRRSYRHSPLPSIPSRVCRRLGVIPSRLAQRLGHAA